MIRGLLLISTCMVAEAAVVPRAVVAVQTPRGDAAAPRIAVGVLRADGILLPFAAYDGKKWSAPWGGRVERGVSQALPVNLAAIPDDWWGGAAPASWNLWPTASEKPQPLKLVSPAMVGIGTSRLLGIRTDYTPTAKVPPFELPYPKAGLAVGGDAGLERIAIVSSLTPAFRQFSAALRPEFTAAEERTLRSLRSDARWRPPFDEKARAAIVPELEAWYISVTPTGERMSYVELVKKYPVVAEDKGCGLETFVSGWVHQVEDPKVKPKTELKAVVTYCDRRDVSYMLPFGTMTLRGKLNWIFQMSGRDHEWYEVVEANPGRAKYVAEYQAGSVPSFLTR